ncbi:MAG: exodeoxyribonuclease VII large subunit [Clostridia bacterium]|nr:exodeoxyribonuclease VII large subunit [Clostridia bacterium]
MQFSFDENGNEFLPEPKSVSEINDYIKSLIEEEMLLQEIYVKGEISNFKKHISSGHFYFTLKDEKSEIRAIMFRAYSQRVKFKIEDGMKVVVHARVGVYQQGGTYQLYADTIIPDGVGELHLAYEQLKAKLAGEGLFEEENKKPLPRFPKRIGIITSATGAAVRDIINVSTRRYPLAELVLFPALVQGEGSSSELIRALEYFNIEKCVDVIIIGRGGGSIEDLWSFNDEMLARTIFMSKIPVISAVGHETDFTICDFVADKRAPTPSAAAELATPDINELKSTLNSFAQRAINAFSNTINMYKDILSGIEDSKVFKKPLSMLDTPRMHLDALSDKISFSFEKNLYDKKNKFSNINGRLVALNPMAILSRGYGALFNSNNEIVNSIDKINIDDKIKINLSDGSINAVVMSKERGK